MSRLLDKEELDILNSYKNNKLKISKTSKDDKKNAKEIAINTIAKSKHISIRLSEKDLKKIKIKAIETGLSYQTLIGLIIHQYAENKIKLEI